MLVWLKENALLKYLCDLSEKGGWARLSAGLSELGLSHNPSCLTISGPTLQSLKSSERLGRYKFDFMKFDLYRPENLNIGCIYKREEIKDDALQGQPGGHRTSRPR